MAGIMFETDETAIKNAIFQNDMPALKTALKAGEDLHYKDRKGNTYLHYLCTMYRPYMIHVIVGTGIDLNAQNRHGNTALHVTALHNDCSHVGDLMAAGIDATIRNKDGKTAAEIPTKSIFWKSIYDKYQPGIFEAVAAHDVDRVLYLLQCWSRVYTTRNGLTLRHFAAAHKFHDLVYHIDFHRHTLGAIYAVLEGDEERAKKRMSTPKCDVNFINLAMESKHILQDALRQRNLKLVHLICTSRVNVNLRVKIHGYLKAPLFFAAIDPKQPEQIMWTVLRAGADFSLRDERGRNAGIYALDKFRGKVPLEVISFMLKNGLDISHRDETGVTLRDVARFSRRKDILTLIDKAFVKLIRTSNITELERLCMRGYDGILINFNYRDTFIYASGNETVEVLDFTQGVPKFCLQVRRLFQCIQNKPLEGFIKVLDDCEKPELLMNAVDKGGRAPVHKCILHWRSDILKELMKRKCNVNLQDNSGRTAYHYACALEEDDEREELCSILLTAGFDKTIKDFQGHLGDFNIGNKEAQMWLSNERKMTYGMIKQITCVDKYEELCHMMKYKKKSLKHFNAAVCRFKYPVPKFEEVLQPLMPDYKDLLFVAIESGKEDIAVRLVKLGANWHRIEKMNRSLNQDSEPQENTGTFSTVLQRAKELRMEELLAAIEKQRIHANKALQEKKETEAETEKPCGKSKISKVRKTKPFTSEEEKKSDEGENDYDFLFEEELVSDSDDSDVLDDDDESAQKSLSREQEFDISSDEATKEIDDIELDDQYSDDSFASDDAVDLLN